MASLIPGYEYDIFISYRQKDNKYDGWVTEFVENLTKELEATFKEDISVYFDINPHDGLLETHDVDASLKEKLKCLVFIPIISRTYCDPKSFAWEHEFRAFVEEASHDQFGLKVKLPSGNVINRVLPVRIHDLDNSDIKLCESVLGGVIRGVEFIYRSAGVNRPLRSEEEKPYDNLNHIIYRDQINKIANAIREIISGLIAGDITTGKEKREQVVQGVEKRKGKKISLREISFGFKRLKFLSAVLSILIVAVVAGLFFYPKIFNIDPYRRLRTSDGKISIAVMPFQNMTNNTIWNIWQRGIQDNLITSLSNSDELKVSQRGSITSIFQSKGLTDYASVTPSVASNISQKLYANVFIYGSIKQTGTTIRLNAQLVDSKTKDVLQSFQIDGTADSILPVIDTLSVRIKNFLIISVLRKEISIYLRESSSAKYGSTNSPDAYRYYVYGQNALANGNMSAAVDFYLQSIAIDSNFFIPYVNIVPAYLNQHIYDQAKKWALKAYEKRDQMPMIEKLYAVDGYALMFGTLNDCVNSARQILGVDDQDAVEHYYLGLVYMDLFQYDKAVPEFERAIEIYNRWGSRPMWVDFYTQLGRAYHKTGQYKKERKIYKKAERDFPDKPYDDLFSYQAVLELAVGDTIASNRYIQKYISLLKENSSSESAITAGLAWIYIEANILDKGEEYLRKALSLEPENKYLMNNLAYFLIDKERNINEGIELAEKVLKTNPDAINALSIKGWGLYKQGKYQDALDFLQKSWELRMKNSVYNHPAFLHLEAAKKL
jgi:TolB-like protein